MKINQIIEAVSKDKALQDIEKVFFGNLKKSKEQDTEVEDVLYAAVRNFIENPYIENKRNALHALRYLHDLKPYYPNDLIPKAKIAYRGTQVKEAHYLKAANGEHISRTNKGTDVDKLKEWLELETMYNPMSEIQSWTTDKSIAIGFATKNHLTGSYQGNYPYPAVMMADVDDSFILTAKLTNLISRVLHAGDEHEIIRVSEKPIKVKMLIKKSWYAFAMEE